MPNRTRRWSSLALIALVAWPATPRPAEAIPAFARKYKVSCALCHAPFPRLTEFGEQFAGNGFMMARGEPGVDTVATGDPMLFLQRDIPLAIRMDAYLGARTGEGGVAAADLKTPWAVKLLSGGQVTEDVAYYMYFYLSERGEVAGIEDAFLQFNDVLGSGVDLVVGQFQVSDPLFKGELRLEYEEYMPYRVRVGDVRADLNYERGLMAAGSPWDGADVFVQMVNGTGLAEAEGREYDSGRAKNFGFRLSQDLGLLRVGGFIYAGRESAEGRESRLRVFGPDVTIPLGGRVEVNGQYLRREDGNPFFLRRCPAGDRRCGFTVADPLSTTVDSYMGEVLYSPWGAGGDLHLAALYNRVQADGPVFTLRVGESGYLSAYESVGVSAHWMRARNLRFMAEITRDLRLDRTRLIAGLVTAF